MKIGNIWNKIKGFFRKPPVPWEDSTTRGIIVTMTVASGLSGPQIDAIMDECRGLYRAGKSPPLVLRTAEDLIRYARSQLPKRRVFQKVPKKLEPMDDDTILRLITSNTGMRPMRSKSRKRHQKFHNRGFNGNGLPPDTAA